MTARPSLPDLRAVSATFDADTKDMALVYLRPSELRALVAALTDVVALADDIAENGVVCTCGHDIGGEHNSFGCYARTSYQPLVTCGCDLTDDQDAGALVADRFRRAITAHVDVSDDTERHDTTTETKG